MTLPARETITPEFIQANVATQVWLRWDYLMMNGIQGPGEMYDFLDYVWKVKQEAKAAGWEFEA